MRQTHRCRSEFCPPVNYVPPRTLFTGELCPWGTILMGGGAKFTSEYCPTGHFVGGQYSLGHRIGLCSLWGAVSTRFVQFVIVSAFGL